MAVLTKDWKSSGEYRIDLWTGSTYIDGGDTQIDCENSLTGSPKTILRNLDSGLPIETTPFPRTGTAIQRLMASARKTINVQAAVEAEEVRR